MVSVRMVEAKAKLNPLDHNGDCVKVKMCIAVFVRMVEAKAKLNCLDHNDDRVVVIKAKMCIAVSAAQMKNYFHKHCRMEVKKWHPDHLGCNTV